ncbi:MAG: hypothetical protein R3288_09420 [Woeseiaceae bacterium]|nr:hypothetical protein [Woeseiaceae bacterium]
MTFRTISIDLFARQTSSRGPSRRDSNRAGTGPDADNAASASRQDANELAARIRQNLESHRFRL